MYYVILKIRKNTKTDVGIAFAHLPVFQYRVGVGGQSDTDFVDWGVFMARLQVRNGTCVALNWLLGEASGSSSLSTDFCPEQRSFPGALGPRGGPFLAFCWITGLGTSFENARVKS